MRLQIHSAGWLLALLVPLFAACMAPASFSEGKAMPVASCDGDGDCAAGLVCEPKVHVCVNEEPLTMTGWLRLVPPAQGMVAVEEQYPGMELDSREDVTLTMHRPLRILGRVLLEGSPYELQEAQIVAVADGSIPDLKIHQDAKATESYQYDYENGQTEKPGFELYVNQEKNYDVYVYLDETEGGLVFPPYHVRRSFSANADQPDPYTIDWTIEVPKITSYHHIVGCLKKSGDEIKPLVGARVIAFASDDGNVSTSGVSGINGCFELMVQPPPALEEVTYEVHIRPSEENALVPEQIVAEVVMPGAAVLDDGDPEENVAPTMDVGDLFVNGLHNVVTVTVEVVAEATTATPDEIGKKDADQKAAALAQTRVEELTSELLGTTVGFSGIVGDGVLNIERSVSDVVETLDVDNGSVRVSATIEVQLPPKQLVLSALPPAQSRFGIQQFLVEIDDGADQPPRVVMLKKKSTTRVNVVDSEGEPVSGASFLGVLSTRGKFADVAPLPSRKYLATETDKGLYELSLDEGYYTWVIDPPAESGLPRLVARDNKVQGISQQRVVDIPPPAVVTGLVYGTLVPDDTETELGGEELAADATEGTPGYFTGPAAGVKVELYDAAEAEQDADGMVPIPLATTSSDTDGRFVLIVPAW